MCRGFSSEQHRPHFCPSGVCLLTEECGKPRKRMKKADRGWPARAGMRLGGDGKGRGDARGDARQTIRSRDVREARGRRGGNSWRRDAGAMPRDLRQCGSGAAGAEARGSRVSAERGHEARGVEGQRQTVLTAVALSGEGRVSHFSRHLPGLRRRTLLEGRGRGTLP